MDAEMRDELAKAALQGLLAGVGWKPGLFVHEDELAKDAYAIADAMLKAREARIPQI